MTPFYQPVQNGISVEFQKLVKYREVLPSESGIVALYWELYASEPLTNDFTYYVMPDACIDLVFDALEPKSPIIMTPRTKTITLRLGRSFHYMGIRFLPGVFCSADIEASSIVGKTKQLDAIGAIDLASCAESIATANFQTATEYTFPGLITKMLQHGHIRHNSLVHDFVSSFDKNISVSDFATTRHVSPRNFRRIVKSQTGFAPTELRRVIRFQDTVTSENPLAKFADQSHLIKEFQRITGMSYRQFTAKFRE